MLGEGPFLATHGPLSVKKFATRLLGASLYCCFSSDPSCAPGLGVPPWGCPVHRGHQKGVCGTADINEPNNCHRGFLSARPLIHDASDSAELLLRSGFLQPTARSFSCRGEMARYCAAVPPVSARLAWTLSAWADGSAAQSPVMAEWLVTSARLWAWALAPDQRFPSWCKNCCKLGPCKLQVTCLSHVPSCLP